jgi:hypothetical protein
MTTPKKIRQHLWNGSLPQGLVSRRIALLHWRTTDAALLALTYTAARLGFEAQSAAAFRLLRLGRGITQNSREEIIPEATAPPALEADRRAVEDSFRKVSSELRDIKASKLWKHGAELWPS